MAEHKMDQGTDEWRAFRLGKASASKVGDIMARTKSGPSTSRNNYLMQLLCERLTGKPSDFFITEPMARGTELEPLARSAYEVDQGVTVLETGCFSHPDIPGFIASPDGLVGHEGMIECKCPNTAQHVGFMRTGEIDSKYQWQMLAQMACSERHWVDYVSYDTRLPDPLQYKRQRFPRDETRIQEMLHEVKKFLAELDALESEMRAMMQQAAA